MWDLLNEKLTDDEYEILSHKLGSAASQHAKIVGDLYEFSDSLDQDFPWEGRPGLNEIWGTEYNMFHRAMQRLHTVLNAHEYARRELQDLLH